MKVWDTQSGEETLTLKGHTNCVSSVAFSPDGKRIVSGEGFFNSISTGELKVWDSQSGQEALTLKGHTDGVWNVAFSPDGKRIVSGSSDKTIKVWNASPVRETPPITRRGEESAVPASVP